MSENVNVSNMLCDGKHYKFKLDGNACSGVFLLADDGVVKDGFYNNGERLCDWDKAVNVERLFTQEDVDNKVRSVMEGLIVTDINGDGIMHQWKDDVVVLLGRVVPTPDTYLDRLFAEREQLNSKVVKLDDFITNQHPNYQALSSDHKVLLNQQLLTMVSYLQILNERLKLIQQESQKIGVSDGE